MSESELGERVKAQMNRPDIHDRWEATYRTTGNERLFEQCYDAIVERVAQPAGSLALDIGCGVCANSSRLARRGYRVEAGDWSEPILERARANLAAQGLADRVNVTRQDIVALTHPDAHFDLTLCWGVLMHIPDIEKALGQLLRVTKRGGYLVFEEVNVSSPETVLDRVRWRLQNLVRDKKIQLVSVESGIEHIVEYRGEKLFWRQIRMRWLIERMARAGCTLVDVRAGMFSEAHLRLPSALRAPFDAWNRFYHRHLRAAFLAKHVVLIFRKG
jgi:ubiquinone/menaquinone biosynthesis C-methylase UbiE